MNFESLTLNASNLKNLDLNILNPNSLKSLRDQDLILSAEKIVEQERKIVQVLIWHLQEIQDRKLFLSLGYDSLYKCLIGHFKMSDTTAYGRIKVLKILDEVPQVSEAIKSGELNVSNIALAHSFIEKHQKSTGELLSQENKIELLESLKNKSTIEARELLAKCNLDMELPHDEIKPLTATHYQVKSTVSKNLKEKMEYLKSLISHENMNPTHGELFELAFDALIEKVEKKKGIKNVNAKASKATTEEGSAMQKNKFVKTATADSDAKSNEKLKAILKPKIVNAKNLTQSLTNGNSRYVSREVKRLILKRAQNCCEYKHSNGERCNSKFQLQFDHIKAFSKGGKTTQENMQLLCRVHNNAKGQT